MLKTGAGLLSPELAFSLEQELDADRLGVQMLKVSGYDPRAALSALNYGYRRSDGGISVRNKNLDLRMAFIVTQLADKGQLRFSSRNNSREFTRLKNILR